MEQELKNISSGAKPVLYAYHPLTALLLFGAVIGLGMLSFHPVYAGLSFVASLLLNLRYFGWRPLVKSLPFFLAMTPLVLLLNTVFNDNGFTELFAIGDIVVFRESLIYGLCSLLVLFGAVLWFCCFSAVIDAERVVFLLGRLWPTMALLLAMILRRMGSVQIEFRQLSEALDTAVPPGKKRVGDRLYHGGIKLSAIIGSSLESAITSSDSMRARGYGTGKQTRLRIHRFHRRDALMLLVLLCALVPCVIARIRGYADFLFYPLTQKIPLDAAAVTGYALFAALLLLPLCLELLEDIKWKRYRSRI